MKRKSGTVVVDYTSIQHDTMRLVVRDNTPLALAIDTIDGDSFEIELERETLEEMRDAINEALEATP